MKLRSHRPLQRKTVDDYHLFVRKRTSVQRRLNNRSIGVPAVSGNELTRLNRLAVADRLTKQTMSLRRQSWTKASGVVSRNWWHPTRLPKDDCGLTVIHQWWCTAHLWWCSEIERRKTVQLRSNKPANILPDVMFSKIVVYSNGRPGRILKRWTHNMTPAWSSNHESRLCVPIAAFDLSAETDGQLLIPMNAINFSAELDHRCKTDVA